MLSAPGAALRNLSPASPGWCLRVGRLSRLAQGRESRAEIEHFRDEAICSSEGLK